MKILILNVYSVQKTRNQIEIHLVFDHLLSCFYWHIVRIAIKPKSVYCVVVEIVLWAALMFLFLPLDPRRIKTSDHSLNSSVAEKEVERRKKKS